MSNTRIEVDPMGEIEVPAQAYYGAQTQRAVLNFPISGQQLPQTMIQAMGKVKLACAKANHDLEKFTKAQSKPLSNEQVTCILKACLEVVEGNLADQFPVDVYQTGSGTSSNMNVNEVIANRAIELSGGDRFHKEKSIGANDHINMGQSTNDTFPTAIHVAAGSQIKTQLIPALQRLTALLETKANEFDEVIKIGRTHLMDATPIRLGQEFSGFARQLQLSVERAERAIESLLELPVGGTTVGAGINTHEEFGSRVAQYLAADTGIPFTEATNHFEANSQRDAVVECHSLLKTVATTLFNVANNIRWLNSGPRCGFAEISLKDRQPGSSAMPGKVNPVLCESIMQLTARVIGNDQSITFAGAAGGQFQLNIMMPMLAQNLLESIELLANGTAAFADLCVADISANKERCESLVKESLAMATALVPYLGHKKADKIADAAFKANKTVREICVDQNLFPAEKLDEIFDPRRLTEPDH